MTNAIPNVPRELLADLLGNDHDKRIMAERHLLAMLANAPSPAGVDGLEVVGYSYGNGILINDTTQPDNPMYTKLVRLSDAKAIIDGLRAQLTERDAAIEEWSGTAVQNGMQCDQQAQRIGELTTALEGLIAVAEGRASGAWMIIDRARETLSAGKEGE